MVDVLKTCIYILNHEPEEWLNFSAGQNFKFNLERYKSYSEISGKFLRILIFIRWFFYRFNPFKSILKKQMEVDIFIYASSINQLSVLDQAKNILIKRKVKVMPISDFLISKEFSHRFNGWEKVYFNFQTLIISIILTLKYIVPLLNRLKKIDKRLPLLRLNGFLSIYVYLPYFYLHLKILNPKIVLVSNDHNPENRCLIEIARHFGIKTAYVQHAGISERFHSLDFDYSFLDGNYSFDIYKKCENRRSLNSKPPKERNVLLTGSLRYLPKKHKINRKCEVVGLTVKGSDSLREIAILCCKITKIKKIIVRPHPSIKYNKFIQQFKNELPNPIDINFSDPRTEEVGQFLHSIDLVIAGNSSILLEAALVGAIPIYYKHSHERVNDYYGFVENGIAPKYESQKEIVNYIETINILKYRPNLDSLRYYNASAHGKHYGLEAEIVAENLISLIKSGELKSQHGLKI